MGGRCRREWTVTAWRALVHEAVAASEPITSGGRDKDAAVAVRLGLLEPIGRRRGDTAGHPILYRPTEAGRLLAEGRIAVASQRTGAPGRPKLNARRHMVAGLAAVLGQRVGRHVLDFAAHDEVTPLRKNSAAAAHRLLAAGFRPMRDRDSCARCRFSEVEDDGKDKAYYCTTQHAWVPGGGHCRDFVAMDGGLGRRVSERLARRHRGDAGGGRPRRAQAARSAGARAPPGGSCST